MKKMELALTPTQAMPVLETLLERIQIRFKAHRGRFSRGDVAVQRAALQLAKLIGPKADGKLFRAIRWSAKERTAWDRKSRR